MIKYLIIYRHVHLIGMKFVVVSSISFVSLFSVKESKIYLSVKKMIQVYVHLVRVLFAYHSKLHAANIYVINTSPGDPLHSRAACTALQCK